MSRLPPLPPRPSSHKVALVAGSYDGPCRGVIAALYAEGYHVYVASRSKSRVNAAIKEITNPLSGSSPAEHPDLATLGLIHFLEIDFTSIDSISAAVRHFQRREPHLDLLLLNVGIWSATGSTDTDAIVQANYILVFVFCLLLLPRLEACLSPRIVHIASPIHYLFPRYLSLDWRWSYRPRRLFLWVRYAHAQLAVIHFIKMLALRNPRVLCLCVDPGLVMNPNLFAIWTRLPIVGILFWCFFELCSHILGINAGVATSSILRCCTDPTLQVEKHSGKYFGGNAKVREPSKVARNMDHAAQTWIWTITELQKQNMNFS